MRDFLEPSDYAVIQKTLPLIAKLECNAPGMSFQHFWKLPQKVQEHIVEYRLESLTGLKIPTTSRFEVYRDEDGGEDHLLVLGFFEGESSERIECMGQYFNGIFVRQPRAVSWHMLEKVHAMSTQKWSWRQLLKSENEADSVFVGIALTVLLSAVGFWLVPSWPSPEEPLKLRLLEYFMCVFVLGSGPLILTVAVLQNWKRFRKRRLEIAAILKRYLDAIPQQARHA